MADISLPNGQQENTTGESLRGIAEKLNDVMKLMRATRDELR